MTAPAQLTPAQADLLRWLALADLVILVLPQEVQYVTAEASK